MQRIRPEKAVITNIQRYSLDDGPGIRTTVFFKGCSLNCNWCHNPECIDRKPQIGYDDSLCVRCKACRIICPGGVHTFDGDIHSIDFKKCEACFACVERCAFGAMKKYGTEMDTEQVLSEILKDREFYKVSGGGVTLSGGEPLLQIESVCDIIQRCRPYGINIAIDTACSVPWENFARIANDVDLFLVDIKAVTEQKHIAATGTGNRLILKNIRRLDEAARSIWIRIPVIPGFHDEQEIKRIADFLSELSSVDRVDLLGYHRYGEGKYSQLGLEYSVGCLTEPGADTLEKYKSIIMGECGLPVYYN